MISLQSCQVQKTLPELWQLFPNQAAVGEEFTLKGAQFGSNPTVTLGQSGSFVTADIRSHDEQTIKAIVPRLAAGPTQVRVTNTNGVSDPLPFIILQPKPVLASVVPVNGLPGSRVTLTGDFLDKVKSIRFGEVPVSEITPTSPQEVVVTVPATIPRGPVTVTVDTEGGSSTGEFIVTGTPEVTSFTPKRAKTGTELVIQGRNLLDGVVRINGQLTDKDQTQVRDTEIRTVIPTTATTGKISITVFERVQATSADTLFIVAAPVINANGLSITEGIAGDKLTLTGQNLRDVTNVSFGTLTAVFKVLSDTQLDVTVPERSQVGEVPVTVSGIGGSTTSQQAFLFIQIPASLVFTPSRTGRGKEVVITGQNLHRITDVTVNGKTAMIVRRTEGTEVRVTVPVDATTGLVAVTNRAGTATTTRSLTVVQKAVVTSFTSSTMVGGRVIIKGNYLQDASVFFTGSRTAAIADGRNEETELWVKVPADAQTGPLTVTNESGETTTTPESFTVLRLPSALEFTPKTGKAGDEVTLTGQNLTAVKDIRFGGGKSTAAKFRQAGNALIVTVPADALTGTICLTTDAGSVCTTSSFTVE
ncbi:hypothetical protein GCM10023189_09720 [Nibrella saemangeumensis]|uniref:IPT/TIG domain-containing protein n=1 Tax=Nibrella saemangeumensis TaxID=1084526 RepID=A0ABP8MH92_9BACT